MVITNLLDKISRPRLTWITAAVVAVVCACIVFSAQISTAWILATTHQPERYTELYFSDQTHLPTQVAPGATNHFAFHLANHESMTETYEYQVVQTDAHGSRVIATGMTTLMDGGEIDKLVTFRIPTAGTTDNITVSLTGMGQQINFRSGS